jgi:hypothetical protein
VELLAQPQAARVPHRSHGALSIRGVDPEAVNAGNSAPQRDLSRKPGTLKVTSKSCPPRRPLGPHAFSSLGGYHSGSGRPRLRGRVMPRRERSSETERTTAALGHAPSPAVAEKRAAQVDGEDPVEVRRGQLVGRSFAP